MILNGAVKVPDPKGNVRTLLQRMELRVGILPEGALMKLSHATLEYHVDVGGELAIPLSISRVTEFRDPVKIELVPNEDQTGFIAAKPIVLMPGDTKCTLRIVLQPEAKLVGEQPFIIRATALQQGKWLVKSETTVLADVQTK